MIKEPKIKLENILKLDDKNFNQDNVCIVTGVSSGIGRAVALAAIANNLTVVGLDINDKEADITLEIAFKLGEGKERMLYLETDLTKDKSILCAVKRASEEGKITYLANIAGIQHIDSIENFPMEKYDLMHRIMLRAPFYLSKLVIPYMKENDLGVIGNMASIHAHICTLKKSAYNLIKFGLKGLTQSIAAEGEGKVRSFSVSTGFVHTPLAVDQVPDQAEQLGMTEEEVIEKKFLGRSKVPRMMNPVEVANLFIFGFSHHSTYLNGGDLLYDGGIVKTY
jgi:3-hydroxybutyrate dehydrogenase